MANSLDFVTVSETLGGMGTAIGVIVTWLDKRTKKTQTETEERFHDEVKRLESKIDALVSGQKACKGHLIDAIATAPIGTEYARHNDHVRAGLESLAF